MTNKINLAYAAGIFDGEGCVSITCDGDNRRYLRVSVVNTYEEVCSWLKQTFGGNYSFQRDKAFLTTLIPFLIIKKKRAEIIQNFPVKGTGQHCTKEERLRREEIEKELRKLNH